MKNSFFDKIENFIDKIENFLMKIIKCKWLWYILVLSLLFFVYFVNYRKNIVSSEINNNSSSYLIITLIISTIVVGILIFNKKIVDVAKKYLIVSLILGMVYTFAAPMFTQSDESFHFIRAYQVSSFHFISPYDNDTGSYDYFPKSIFDTLYDDDDRYPEYKNYDDIDKLLKIDLNKEEIVKNDVRASNYIFINYIPQTLGIGIGRLLNLSPYLIGVLGRLFNMIACTLIIYLGLRIIPICKKALSILFIAPSVIAYNASLSADGILVAMAFLLVSLVLYCMYKKPKFNIKWYVLFIIIITFVSTCKTAYLPLIGIVLFIPNECFKNKRQRWFSTLLLIAYGIIISLIWLSFSKVTFNMDSNYTGIMKYINFIKVFFYTYMVDTVSYIQNIFAGYYLYQKQVIPFLIIPSLYFIIFMLSFFNEENKIKVKNIQKIVVSIIALLVVVLISYALFIGNTDKSSYTINGIQGRYFVPVLLLIPFFVGRRKMVINENLVFDIAIFLNFSILLTMINSFII